MASAAPTHESRAAGHCDLQAQLTTACFNIQYRNLLRAAETPVWDDVKRMATYSLFEDSWITGLTQDFSSGTRSSRKPSRGWRRHLPPSPALHWGRDFNWSQKSSWKQQHLGHVPERGGQCFLPWQANSLCPPSACFLNFLEQEDCSVFK